MLKTYFKIEDFTELPWSNGLYFIDMNGVLKDAVGEVIPTSTDAEGIACVRIYWIFGHSDYQLSFLLLATYKPLAINFKRIKPLKAEYLDGNKNNLTLGNLIWRFPVNGLEVEDFPGFYYIPGKTNYGIDKDGKVYNLKTKNFLSEQLHKKGYIYYSLREDVPSGKSQVVGRHRLLAFTFLPYPANADFLEVNHINGIPGDDRLDNLEWVTRSRNILHAYESGLRDDNIKVKVTNTNTGEVRTYFSAHDCERQMGLSRSVVHYRLKSGRGKTVYKPGYVFDYLNGEPREKAKQISLKVYDSLKKKTTIYPSVTSFTEEIGISKKVIQRRLKCKTKLDWKNFHIEKMT